MITREQVYQALFALLVPLGPTGTKRFKTVTRTLVPVQSIAPGLQPILMMDEAFETTTWPTRGARKKTFTCFLHIGCTTAAKLGLSGSATLNPLIDAVEEAVNAVRDGPQTLGGLVEDVYIRGQAMKDTGDNMQDPSHRQAVYYMPIEIILPAY